MPEIAPGSQSVSNGWTALSRGSWKEARTIFEQELEAGESAEALEGLSWAAWWLDDAHTVFEARERAYRLYSEGRDPASAARMATWLAADHLDFHGALAVAKGWLRRAGRMLEPLDPGPDHGWLAFHEGHIAGMCGDPVKAAELGVRAAKLGRRFQVRDLEMLGMALQGASLVASAQVEEGMRFLDEATAVALAGEATVPISSAWTCCFLVSACTAVLDYGRAFEWCDRIAEFAERYGSRYMLAFCRAEYGAVHVWRGRWADAETLLEASIEDFSRSRPAWAEGPLVTLAELRRRQGWPADVVRMLDQAGCRDLSAAFQPTARSRRRSAHSPAANSVTAMASRASSGPAVTSPPGRFGTCVNGESSRTQRGRSSSGPISLARKVATSTAQAIGAARRESPYRARLAPTSTQTAGSRTTAARRSAPNTLGSPLSTAWARPTPSPQASIKIPVPTTAMTR
jgi:hypothetical protein